MTRPYSHPARWLLLLTCFWPGAYSTAQPVVSPGSVALVGAGSGGTAHPHLAGPNPAAASGRVLSLTLAEEYGLPELRTSGLFWRGERWAGAASHLGFTGYRETRVSGSVRGRRAEWRWGLRLTARRTSAAELRTEWTWEPVGGAIRVTKSHSVGVLLSPRRIAIGGLMDLEPATLLVDLEATPEFVSTRLASAIQLHTALAVLAGWTSDPGRLGVGVVVSLAHVHAVLETNWHQSLGATRAIAIAFHRR